MSDFTTLLEWGSEVVYQTLHVNKQDGIFVLAQTWGGEEERNIFICFLDELEEIVRAARGYVEDSRV